MIHECNGIKNKYTNSLFQESEIIQFVKSQSDITALALYQQPTPYSI